MSEPQYGLGQILSEEQAARVLRGEPAFGAWDALLDVDPFGEDGHQHGDSCEGDCE